MKTKQKSGNVNRHQKIMLIFFVVLFLGGTFFTARPVVAIADLFDTPFQADSLDDIFKFFPRVAGNIIEEPLQAIGGEIKGAAVAAAEGIGNLLINAMVWMMMGIGNLFMKLAVFFLDLFMEIAGYNDFMSAPPVMLGWLVIRDLANMFFIVALLVIAFGTILGIEKYEWKRALVKLVLVAIFINFSKLILQLVIDAANVLTQTFLFAFRDAAGGNFIKMFKLDELYTMVEGAVPNGNIDWDSLAAAVFALIFSIMTMATIGAYLVIMLARMVVLWCLMIISPLAFVAHVFPFAQSFANEFWSKFLHHVIVAPVMVFFLWLSFATLGAGKIAQDINIQTSELVRSGLAESGASITLSQASTPESMSSFAITLAFMIAGLTFVQRLGVVGGGMAAGAMNFTKRVATIATGYAAGRWLAGKGKQAGLKVLEDYGKIAWGQTGARLRHAPGLRNVPLFGAAGAERRKAAVDKLAKIEEARKQKYREEGGGIPGLLMGGTAERLARAEADLGLAREEKESKAARLKNEYIAEVLFKGDFPDYFANREKILKEEYGIDFSDKNYSGLADKLKKAIAGGEFYTAMDTMNDIDSKARKLEVKDKKGNLYDYQQSREVDKKAAKKSLLISSALERIHAEEMAGKATSRKDFIEGGFNLGYATRESKVLDDEVAKINARLIEEKTGQSTKKQQDEAYKKYSEGSGKTMKEVLALPDEEKRKIMDSYSATLLTNQEKTLAYKREGIYDNLNKIGGEYLTHVGTRRKKKTKTVVEQMSNRVGDYARGEENKVPELERAAQRRKAMEDATEYNTYSIGEGEAELAENHATIKRLEAKPKEELTDEEKNALYNATQRQFRIVANFMTRYPGMMPAVIGGLDNSFKGVNLTDPEEMQNMLMGFFTGRSYDDVKDNFSELQEQVRERLKEKDTSLFRALQMGLNEAAKNQFVAAHGQVDFGVDGSGIKKMGLTNSFGSGLGSGSQLGTGMVGVTGSEYREKDLKENVLPYISLRRAEDARALAVVDGTGKTVRLLSEEAEREVLSIASMAKATIQGMSANNLYSLTGGSSGASSWDGKKFNVTEQMMLMNKKLMSGFIQNFNNANTQNNRDNVLASMREFLRKLKVDKVNDVDTLDANIEDMRSFLKKKLEMEVVIKPLEKKRGSAAREEEADEETE